MLLKDNYGDQKLLNDIKSSRAEDNNRGFAFLYRKHFQSFIYFVRSNSGSEEEAKDVFQEGIITFYNKVKQPGSVIEYASTFFFSICKNLWMDKRRQKANQERIIQEALPAADSEDHLENVLEKERNQILFVLLEKLGDGCHTILLSFYYEKKSMKEITEEMGLASEAVAKNKKSHCMKKLRDMIINNQHYREVLKY